MSVGNILFTIFIGPLQLLFEVIFSFANRYTGNPGFTIIFLSLAMNLLVLPLYIRADALQEEERVTQMKLSEGVSHIKKMFKGDERMMILQTYYRQNNYKPTYVLRSAMSLFLEIPFFFAAYRFLSHLSLLNGVSFGPIADLSKPDALIIIGSFTINILPVIMTLLNVISTYIFTKGYPVKTKLQLYGLALFFLIFLYTSPSGLVFYWTLNNLFSLAKTVVYKIKDSGIFSHRKGKIRLNIPEESYKKAFYAGTAFLAVLMGGLIPSNVIKDSPQEFLTSVFVHNPLSYVLSAMCLALGIFVVWGAVFYGLAKEKTKVLFEDAVLIFGVVAIVDYMLFGKNLGVILSTLKFEKIMVFTGNEKIINLAVICALVIALFFVLKKWKKTVSGFIVVCCVAIGMMTVFNLYSAGKDIREYSRNEKTDDEELVFSLSKEGKNVVVLMLDRAMGEMVPYIMSEKPELKEAFDGFKYYPNTISYGGHTVIGAPGLFGGYEYIPVNMNKRDKELLADKHDEALKVMPVMFANKGYNVTVCDPSCAGYEWIPDLSIYDEYSEHIKAYSTEGMYSDIDTEKALVETLNRNFFCYSFMKCMPIFTQQRLYDSGNYFNLLISAPGIQDITSMLTAEGKSSDFDSTYSVLSHLNELTQIDEGTSDNFLMMTNDTPHNPALLQKDGYTPELMVDNSQYGEDDRTADEFFANIPSNKLIMTESTEQVIHYHANMATYIQLANWFDYLRKQGVYDNTRIILVSDHGHNTGQVKDLIKSLDDGSEFDLNIFFPLLMVKDFNSEGFSVESDYMTNADTPVIALEGIDDDMINPFTGNVVSSQEKNNGDAYVLVTDNYRMTDNPGNTFTPTGWFKVNSDDVSNVDNWEMTSGTVLPE